MSSSVTIQIRGKGSLTLPVELRRKYDLDEGDIITLIDLGGGHLLLAPGITSVDRFGDRVARTVANEETSLDEILEALDEEREQYYQDHYAGD